MFEKKRNELGDERYIQYLENKVMEMKSKDNFNICLATDSYKLGHYKQYLPNTKKVYSYLEARNGAKFNKTVMFGLQYILMKYLSGQVVTAEKINSAQKIVDAHLGKGVFNREGWEYILNKHNGYLPVIIHAVPEGTIVDVSNVMMTVENTDENCPWLTNFLESILMHVWYSMSIATYSHECKIMLKDYLNKTTNDFSGLDFMLHDFGYRSVSSHESASIGGAAHLLNFLGTDTIPALDIPNTYYGLKDNVAGFSVAATEHSVMTARGKEGEFNIVEHILNTHRDGILSMVIDSYNYENFIITCGEKFKNLIDSRNGRTVFRPDSGDPITVTLKCLELLEKYWGTTVNEKGFKVLPNHIRVLWGDGIDYYGMRSVLFAMFNNLWSAENIVFGMGGGLLQKTERDMQRMAFKCSCQFYNGEWHDVYKEPKDLSKASKRGRLALIKNPNGKYQTIRLEELGNRKNELIPVFANGKILNTFKWKDMVAEVNKDI